MRETALVGGASDEEDGAERTGPADGPRMRAIVAQHYDFIWRSLRRLGVEERAVEDAAQNVFVVASNKVGPVPADRERAFLFAIALRTASTHRRQKRRRPETQDDEEIAALASGEPGPDELIDRKKARVLMDALTEELPLEARTVFVLFEMEEYTMAQIAELLELPAGTVASRLRRARELFDAALVRYQARNARRREP